MIVPRADTQPIKQEKISINIYLFISNIMFLISYFKTLTFLYFRNICPYFVPR